MSSSSPSSEDAPAPRPLAHYSPVVVHGNVAYCAGSLGVTSDGELAGDDVGSQTRQALENLAVVLGSVGSGLDALLQTSCFLARPEDFEAFDAAYGDVLGSHLPARTTVVATLLFEGALVEISALGAVT